MNVTASCAACNGECADTADMDLEFVFRPVQGRVIGRSIRAELTKENLVVQARICGDCRDEIKGLVVNFFSREAVEAAADMLQAVDGTDVTNPEAWDRVAPDRVGHC